MQYIELQNRKADWLCHDNINPSSHKALQNSYDPPIVTLLAVNFLWPPPPVYTLLVTTDLPSDPFQAIK